MADTKITNLNEGTVLDLLDWLVAVDVSNTTMPGGAGTNVKVKVDTLVNFLKLIMAPLVQPITAKTADYTPALVDVGYIITVNAALNKTITMPQFTTVAFAVGSWFEVIQLGAGKILFLPEGGAVGYRTRAAGSRVKCQLIATDTWHISGDLEVNG